LPDHARVLGVLVLLTSSLPASIGQTAVGAVSPDRMKAIYEEVKTPFKYGIVLEPPEAKKVDCPTVFRHHGKWYMVYVQLEPAPLEGYTTQLAESENLLEWKPLGTSCPAASKTRGTVRTRQAASPSSIPRGAAATACRRTMVATGCRTSAGGATATRRCP
jgi:hypothetical protein